MKLKRAFALAVACIANCAGAQQGEPRKWEPQPPTDDEKAQVERIAATGRDIYRLDQLAWRATDLLIAKIGKRKARKQGGWVITEDKDHAQITFIEERSPEQLTIMGDVVVTGAEPQLVVDPKRDLSELERALYRARGTALNAARNGCSKTFNTATLPNGDDWDVYVLAASEKEGFVPIGGHTRVKVSHDGATVLEQEPYSKSCVLADARDPHLVSLMSTHILSNLPAPTHVFASLTYRKSIVIATRTHLWKIENGQVTSMGDSKPSEPRPAAEQSVE